MLQTSKPAVWDSAGIIWYYCSLYDVAWLFKTLSNLTPVLDLILDLMGKANMGEIFF